MTIFVGGAKHGTDYGPHDGPLSPLYVDVTAGDRYSLAPVQFQLPHPITGEPDQAWENTVYLHDALAADPQQGMAALQDAVTRWWFTTHGTHKPLSTPDKNGQAEAMPALYSVRCEQCQTAEVFVDLIARAEYMREHIDTTGHTVRWSDHVPTTEGASDGGQRLGDIQER